MNVNGRKLVTAVPLCSPVLQLLATYYRSAEFEANQSACRLSAAEQPKAGARVAAGSQYRTKGRKSVLLSAASILALSKLAQCESGARVPATVCAIADSIRWAEQIMEEIDRRHPVKPAQEQDR
jgi:hypothetical protein